MSALDALDRGRTLALLTVSPLEVHGPHLPLGVDAFTGRYFAEAIAGRLVETRPGWSAVLAPTLHLGSFTFDGPGTIPVRQRVVRDVVVDYGSALARQGFRYVVVANGHAGLTHLTALEEAASIVSRRHGIAMASLSSRLAWSFRAGLLLGRIEAALGRALTAEERRAFAEDAHGGWWETSMMLMLRPDLVDDGFRDLPPATYSLPERLVPNYPLREGGAGYVGHPALGDPAFAKATAAVLIEELMALIHDLLDDAPGPGARRSPFYRLPFFRTEFWPTVAAGSLALAALAWLLPRRPR